ncbi:MAG: D-2-hydroxyacid dehydrogenase [Aminipila sp.]
MKIVVLDGATIDRGLSWNGLEELGELIVYPRTPKDLVIERIHDADAVFATKVTFDQQTLSLCKKLKFVGMMATGYNNIDLDYCKKSGIAVCNIPAYSTDAVAQHTFALILEVCNNVALHNNSVKQGDWAKSEDFCYWKAPVLLLKDKSLGIIGYGNIGKKVAEIAKAFGMKVNVYSQNKEAAITSDILTLHCPATKQNIEFINNDFINQMKDGAILINTARGTLINEHHVAEALKSRKLSAFGADVLSKEPADIDNPLINLDNSYITPHMCWTSIELRRTIIQVSIENLKSFINGDKLNRVDL